MRSAGYVVLLALLAPGGCTASDSSICLDPPVVTVTNEATGQFLCTATVTAIPSTALDAGTVLYPSEPDDAGACDYGNPAFSDLSPFTITASQPGFQTTSASNARVVRASPCYTPPSPEHVNIVLQPD
jgi:hypothetical protein